MYQAILLAATLLAVVTPPSGTQHARPGAALSRAHASATRPNVIENGSDFVSFPFPAGIAVPGCCLAPGLAFGPDGSIYFVGDADYAPRLTRLSPDGTYASTSSLSYLPGANSILYAAGNLWFPTTGGVEKISPDGTRHRFYNIRPQGLEGGPTYNVSIGPDGAIYGAAYFFGYGKDNAVGAIFRIAVTGAGAVTRQALSILPYPAPTIFDRLGRLYLTASAPNAGGVTFIARVNSDGSTTTLQLPKNQALYGGFSSVASSGNYVYFTATVAVANGYSEVFGRIAPDGTITELPYARKRSRRPIGRSRRQPVVFFPRRHDVPVSI
jgi:hypothetical protein